MNTVRQMKLAQFIVAFLVVGAINSQAQATRQPQNALDAHRVKVADNTPPLDAVQENEEDRLWSDNSGDFQIRAKLVDLRDNDVYLERDNNQIGIPLSRLSTNDQVYVRNEMRKRKSQQGHEPTQIKQGLQEEGKKTGVLTQDEIYNLLLNPNPAPTYKDKQGIRRCDGVWTQGRDADSVLKLLGNPDATFHEDRCWRYDNKCIHPLTKKVEDLYVTVLKILPDFNHTDKIERKVVFFKMGKQGEPIGYDAWIGDEYYPKETHLFLFCKKCGVRIIDW